MVSYKRTTDKTGVQIYPANASTYQQLMQLQQPFVPVSCEYPNNSSSPATLSSATIAISNNINNNNNNNNNNHVSTLTPTAATPTPTPSTSTTIVHSANFENNEAVNALKPQFSLNNVYSTASVINTASDSPYYTLTNGNCADFNTNTVPSTSSVPISSPNHYAEAAALAKEVAQTNYMKALAATAIANNNKMLAQPALQAARAVKLNNQIATPPCSLNAYLAAINNNLLLQRPALTQPQSVRFNPYMPLYRSYMPLPTAATSYLNSAANSATTAQTNLNYFAIAAAANQQRPTQQLPLSFFNPTTATLMPSSALPNNNNNNNNNAINPNHNISPSKKLKTS